MQGTPCFNVNHGLLRAVRMLRNSPAHLQQVLLRVACARGCNVQQPFKSAHW